MIKNTVNNINYISFVPFGSKTCRNAKDGKEWLKRIIKTVTKGMEIFCRIFLYLPQPITLSNGGCDKKQEK